VPKRLAGLDPTSAVLDEFGVISRDAYEVIALAAGKPALLAARQACAR
jgi:hypothetical protein